MASFHIGLLLSNGVQDESGNNLLVFLCACVCVCDLNSLVDALVNHSSSHSSHYFGPEVLSCFLVF